MDTFREISHFVKADPALHLQITELAETERPDIGSDRSVFFKNEARRLLECPTENAEGNGLSTTDLKSHCLRISTPQGDNYLVVVAPPIGGSRIYYSHHCDTLYLAQRASTLAALQEQTRILDSSLQEQLYTRLNTPGVTLYQSVNYVPPGSLLAISMSNPHKPELIQYFDVFNDTRPPKHFPSAPNTRSSLEQYTLQLEQSIMEYWKNHYSAAQPVTVLLSGGYDSALLLALAKRYFEKVIAVSADWDKWPNPELVVARKVAAHMQVEHKTVTIDDDEIAHNFHSQIASHEKIIRNQSSLVMPSLLKECEKFSRLVIYGEGADILFGSADTFTMARKVLKSRKLAHIPRLAKNKLGNIVNTLPANRFSKKLTQLLELNESMVIQQLNYIGSYRQLKPYLAEPELDSTFLQKIQSAEGFESVLKLAQRRSLQYNIADHLFDIHECACGLTLTIDAPFLANKVIDLAFTLNSKDQFHDNVYKPIVRHLVSLHYPEGIFPTKKMGFSVPSKPWADLLMHFHATTATNHLSQQVELLESLKSEASGSHEIAWSYLNVRNLV